MAVSFHVNCAVRCLFLFGIRYNTKGNDMSLRQVSFSKIEHNGKIISSQPIAGFHLTETVYAPNITVPKHSHQLACFCLVLQGNQ